VTPSGGELIYVNAGHNPPLLYRSGSGSFEELGRTGLVLGVDASIKLDQHSTTLEPGDCLVLYTDGVTDALNASEQPFGEQRLRSSIEASVSGSAQAIALGLLQALQEFIGGADPFDDITLLVAKRS